MAKVDEARVADLAYKGLSNRMIAVLVGINHKTLARRFAPKLAYWRAMLALHIHERQFEILNGAAGPGSAVKMAIWLGKNELGQSERPAAPGQGDVPIIIEFISDASDALVESPSIKVFLGADEPPEPSDYPPRHVDSNVVEQIGVSHDDSQER